MEEAWLRAELESGRSIESIAREVGKAPSTVAYWVDKFGLESQHAGRHAARGGVPRERLVAMLDEGLSIRAMAEQLGLSYAAVRHWLGRYEITTPRGRRLAETAGARAGGDETVSANCPVHGLTLFIRRGGGFRCRRCRAEAVDRRRRSVKAWLIAEAGGSCVLCGYDRCAGALQFHHVDPRTKAFGISDRGLTRSMERARAEAAKCVLVCANCHAEIETGLATIAEIPPGRLRDRGAAPQYTGRG